MSIKESNKKVVLNGGSAVSVYLHNPEMIKQKLPQPDLRHINFSTGFSREEFFKQFQESLARCFYDSHLVSCPKVIQYRVFPIIKGEPCGKNDLTMRCDYTQTIQFHDQTQQYNELLEVQRRTEVDLRKRRVSTKNVQSKFKNIYGLVVGRVIKSCKEYFRAIQEVHGNEEDIRKFEDGRFRYIHDRLNIKSLDLQGFQGYLNSYYNRDPELKKKRGKLIVQEYLMQDTINGSILADLIIMFLDERNSDFQNYTSNDTKPKGQILKVLLNHTDLEKLRDKFKEMKATIKEQDWKSVKINKEEELG